MKTLKDDDLQIAVDTFEEASEDDYRVLVVRKKNIRSLVNSKKDSGYRPKNYFRFDLLLSLVSE